MAAFYELRDEMCHPGRWHLRTPEGGGGQDIDLWQLRQGLWLGDMGRIRFPVHPRGQALDFTLASFAIPVVHARVKQLFEGMGLADVQFLPAGVEGYEGPYFVLNPLRVIRCIDDARCAEVQYWQPEDGQPERVGEYRVVAGMRIDPEKAKGADIFRPWGWTVALIVSERLKQALEAAGVTGPRFVEV